MNNLPALHYSPLTYIYTQETGFVFRLLGNYYGQLFTISTFS